MPDTACGALESHLREQRAAGRKLLVPYVTGGLGESWTDIAAAYIDAGADAIEVGLPFSDPAMDGPTIQEASSVALERGANPANILDDLRRLDAPVPIVVMTYYNLVFRAGLQRFASELVEAGVAGVILPDVPLEEQGPWAEVARPAGLDTVLLAGPVTPDDRLGRVCAASQGFVYGVNLMGVTGERVSLGEQSGTLARRLKAATDLPVIMGFGVATPEAAAEVAAPADGVIVASAIMRRVLDGASAADAGRFVAGLRAALDG
jgi:tryptophan synthase alpha chain